MSCFQWSVKISWLPLGNSHQNSSMWIIWETHGWNSGCNWALQAGDGFQRAPSWAGLWEHHPRPRRALGARLKSRTSIWHCPAEMQPTAKRCITTLELLSSVLTPAASCSDVTTTFQKCIFSHFARGKHPKWQQELVFRGEHLKLCFYHAAWSRQKRKWRLLDLS